jgi:FkbM family methyltransferase
VDWILDALRPYPFRGKVRLLNPLIPRTGQKTAPIFGSRLRLDLSNYVDRTIYMGCYEPLNTLRFKRILSAGMTVVDVGANIGYFSLLAANCVGPSGKVIAIEPHPANFKILSDTVAANRLSQIHPFQMGLSDVNAVAEISMADQVAFPNRTASMVPGKNIHSVTVPVKRLDDCVADWGIKQIDLLKIDVDGFELKIVSGAAVSLEKGLIKNIIIEFDEFWLKEMNSSTTMLREAIEGAGLVDVTDTFALAGFLLGKSEDRHFTLLPRA